MEELDKKYDHKLVEANKYKNWLEKDYFKAGNLNKEPFTIIIPPPNVTGKLHLGHAWNTTLQDIIIRYKRMDGYDALWLPGMDHAGIATQAKVDERLKNDGINPRDMDREEWVKIAWSWKEEYASIIRKQWEKLGLSLDYSRERFTLDEGSNQAVNKAFVDLYKKGIIYRGKRIINWDPKAKTALSNIEVLYEEVDGYLYTLKYYLKDSNEYILVATTRPETIFGDIAIVVNPKDERYKKYIGKEVIVPYVGRKIIVITDEYAEMDFGTGAVKITPAHDPNDYLIGEKNNLEMINCLNEDATLNNICGEFAGMDRFVAREQLIKKLTEMNLVEKVEPYRHSVGFSERTKAIVEPYLSDQWFVKMEILAKNSLKNQEDVNTKVNFVPERFEKVWTNWMNNVSDWCISRQLWWGHQIPAWYKDQEVYVGINPPQEEGWIRDKDVLDTWFSSALWPFSTLGWPNNLDTRYFETNVLVTAYDIIFFWVSRMMFQSLEFTNKRPFKDTLIHGLVRDKNGVKMSKSLGNGVDPMDVIEEYGADSLRFFLTTNTAPGLDLRYDSDKVKSTWNFINKLWNASRYVLMNIENEEVKEIEIEKLSIYDKWILSKLNKVIDNVRFNMEKYEFHNVGNLLYTFTWNVFCDWYIELSKINLNSSVIIYVLDSILKMLHPFMPYVTEEIYTRLPNSQETIVTSNYPKVNKEYDYKDEEETIDDLIEFITNYRNKKQELNIGKDYTVKLETKENLKPIIRKMLKISPDMENINEKFANIVIKYKDMQATIYYNNNLTEDDLLKVTKEKELLINNIERRKALLSNQGYLNKAPKELVEKEKITLEEEIKKLETLTNN